MAEPVDRVVEPLAGLTLDAVRMERHAFSSQSFIPMDASRYLVWSLLTRLMVARTPDRRAPSSPAVIRRSPIAPMSGIIR